MFPVRGLLWFRFPRPRLASGHLQIQMLLRSAHFIARLIHDIVIRFAYCFMSNPNLSRKVPSCPATRCLALFSLLMAVALPSHAVISSTTVENINAIIPDGDLNGISSQLLTGL